MKIEVKNPNNLPTIEYSKLEDLQKDLKTITKENLEKLKNSIKNYGFFVPCFVWIKGKHYYMLDAHQRFKACISLESEGYEIPELPYVEIQAKNKKEAGEKLLQINSRYGIINPDTTFFEDFDIDLSFINEIEIPELDIDNLMPEYEGQTDEDVIPEEIEPICKTGDLWQLGEHRLLCGDATKKEDVDKLINKKKVSLIFNDPPFDLDINDIYKVFENCLKLEPDIQFWMGSDKQQILLTSKYFDLFCHFFVHNFMNATLISNNQVMQQHSLISKFGNVKINNLKDGFSTIIDAQTMRIKKEHKEFNMGKNVKLPEQFILHYSKINDIIVDLFGGFGSTLIASEILNRKCFMVEIDPHYCDVIIKRYEDYSGKKAKLLK